MGAKRFDCLNDFSRHGVNIHLACGNGRCDHTGVVDPWAASTYFRLHRWGESLDIVFGYSARNHFRCSRCGHHAGAMLPTNNPVTVTNFFPVGQDGWRALQRRLSG